MAENTGTTRNSASTIPPVTELSYFSFNLNYPDFKPSPSKIITCEKCVAFGCEFNILGASKKSKITNNTPVHHFCHSHVMTNIEWSTFTEAISYRGNI